MVGIAMMICLQFQCWSQPLNIQFRDKLSGKRNENIFHSQFYSGAKRGHWISIKSRQSTHLTSFNREYSKRSVQKNGVLHWEKVLQCVSLKKWALSWERNHIKCKCLWLYQLFQHWPLLCQVLIVMKFHQHSVDWLPIVWPVTIQWVVYQSKRLWHWTELYAHQKLTFYLEYQSEGIMRNCCEFLWI